MLMIDSFSSIPQAMRQRRQWINWKLETRGENAKPTKVPYQPNGFLAKSNDPNTWHDFSTCVAALPKFSGLGFCFHQNDGLVGIDLDHCLNPDGTLDSWAQDILAHFPNTYIEFSPSGDGLHIWCSGSPARTGQKKWKAVKDGQEIDLGFEVYNYSSPRYFTVTGDVSNAFDIADGQLGLDWLYDHHWSTPAPAPALAPADLALEQPTPPQYNSSTTSEKLEMVRLALQHIPADDRETWIKIGMALKAGGADLSDWESWSSTSAKYVPGECAKKWRSFNASKLSFGTIFFVAGQYGFAFPAVLPQKNRPVDSEKTKDKDKPPKTTAKLRSSSIPKEFIDEIKKHTSGFFDTDRANGIRFVQEHGTDYLFVPEAGWFRWIGTRYSEDTDQKAKIAAAQINNRILQEDESLFTDTKAQIKCAKRALNVTGIRATLEMASPLVSTAITAFDNDPYLLNCANGTINLRTGNLQPHSQQDLCTKFVDIEYDPNAQCPIWDSFLHRIMSGDPEMIEFLQRAVGYSLTGDTGEQCLFFTYGTGANGKSKFLEVLEALCGTYGDTINSSTLSVKDNQSGATPELAKLVGKRLVTCNETSSTQRFDEALLKNLSGEDVISARLLYQKSFKFKPIFKLWIRGNHKPQVNADAATFRRLHLIPFEVQIPPSERDTMLSEKLKSEYPGILAWAVRGCLAWQTMRLFTPDKVTEATKEYQEENDSVGLWIEDCVVVAGTSVERPSALYDSYQTWSKRNGLGAMGSKKFYQDLVTRGFKRDRMAGGKRERYYSGLMLLPNSEAAS